MPASEGTPTVLEKLAAALGFGAAVGMTPDEIAATQAGDQRDLTKGEQDVVLLFKPILTQAETTGLADLTNIMQTVLTLIPSISSVSSAVGVIQAILKAEAGPLAAQAEALGQTSLTTLVSAVLAGLGKTNLPA